MMKEEGDKILYDILHLLDIEIYGSKQFHWSPEKWKKVLQMKEIRPGAHVVKALNLRRM